MRITHSMMGRNYLNTLNKNLKNLSGSNEKLSSQRAFSKGWENVGDANRALRVRKLLNDNERQLDNIRDVQGLYSNAEDNMRAVNTILQNVTDLVVQGMNGTIPAEDKEKIAREISNLQEEVFQISNSQYNDSYVFNATGNKDGSAPFTMDADGKLSFNGTPVDDIVADANGDPTYNGKPIPYNGTNYLDIGLSFSLNATGEVDPRSAVKTTFSGAEIFGFGTNADGLPNNIYSLLGRISDDMRSGDVEALGKDFEQMKTRQSDLLMNITDLGNLSAFADQTAERLENDTINQQTIQNGLEAVPLSEEIMYNKDFEMAWMVTLQLGSKILPPSIFDFIK